MIRPGLFSFVEIALLATGTQQDNIRVCGCRLGTEHPTNLMSIHAARHHNMHNHKSRHIAPSLINGLMAAGRHIKLTAHRLQGQSQQYPDIFLVIDDQDSIIGHGFVAIMEWLGSHSRRRRRTDYGQPKGHFRSYPRSAAHRHLTIEDVHDLLDQTHPQSCPGNGA